MLENMLIGLEVIMTPIGMLYIFGGAFAGMVLGAIPGLSGGTLTILILPMTYKMDPALTMGLFIGILVGSCSGGCIGSILLGIPGTGSSIITCWDGYEFTKKGDPVRALSAAVISNFVGTIPSLLIAMFMCPILGAWAVKLGPWEYFALCFCALAMIVGLSKGDMVRGIIAICFGALVSCIGIAPLCGNSRLTFGVTHLKGGIQLVACMMGLFAANRMLMEYSRQSRVNSADNIKVTRFRFPAQDIKDNMGNIVRSFLTGVGIGFLPGMGSGVSTALAYANEKKLSKNPEEWGHGAIGGVIAPETANNATIGGALIPMLALGIPGDGTTAIFMTTLTMQGITCGPLLTQNNPDIVYTIYLGAILAGIFVLLIQTLGMPLFPALLKIPYHYLYPAIIIVCFVGAYLSTSSMFGVITVIVFCAIGIAMEYFKVPMMPFMMGFILSDLLETNLRQALNFGGGAQSFLTRPFAMIFIIIGAIILLRHPLVPMIERRKARKAA